MNLFNKILNKFYSRFKVKYLNSNWYPLKGYSSIINDYYKSFIYACCSARAENISKARIYLYRRVKTTSGLDEIYDHPFLDLINTPNVFEQGFETLLYLISVSLDLYGNAYLFIQRNENLMPAGLYFMPSSSTGMKLNQNRTRIEYYEYREGSKFYKIPTADVIHFKIPNPESNLSGKSIISAFNFTLEIEYLQNLYQKNFYLNDSSLGLILETDKNLTDDDIDRLKKNIEDKFTGSENAGKTLILSEGLKAKPYTPPPKDSGLVESRTMIRDEILAVMRVPKPILGITTEVNYANAREALKIFNDYTIKPFAKLCIESRFNTFIKKNYNDNKLECSFEYEYEQDRQTQLKTIETYRKWKIATINEIRELEGFEKLKRKKADEI